jgi:hypothetical protein
MNIDDALALIDEGLPRGLSTIQELVVRLTLEDKTYHEAAEICGYDASYIRDVGYKLWGALSKSFGEKVKKGNLQVILRKQAQKALQHSLQSNGLTQDCDRELNQEFLDREAESSGSNVIDFQKAVANRQRDLGMAINSSMLIVDFGTEENLINFLTRKLDEAVCVGVEGNTNAYSRNPAIGVLRELPMIPSSILVGMLSKANEN